MSVVEVKVSHISLTSLTVLMIFIKALLIFIKVFIVIFCFTVLILRVIDRYYF